MSAEGRLIYGFLNVASAQVQAKPQRGHAEASADEDLVSRPGARAEQCPAPWYDARHNDICGNGAPNDRSVAANDGHGKSPSESEKSIKEAFQPRALGMLRHGE